MLQSILLCALAFPSVAPAFLLQSPLLNVVLDDVFPAPLSYTLASTNETLRAGLRGPDFHVHLSLNRDQVTCGEAGISTQYSPQSSASTSFATTAFCALAYGGGGGGAPPSWLKLVLNGTVSVAADAAVLGAALFTLQFDSAQLLGDGAPPLSTINVAGLELLSLHPPRNVSACMYTPTMNGKVPACAGDFYFADSWQNLGIDEWNAFTWDLVAWVEGQADVNSVPHENMACLEGALSRHTPGPLLSVFAGGWTSSGRTGAAVLSSEKHAPFWTGLRSFDVPGRCSVFTVAPATLHPAYLCGSGLPITLTVGIFPDVTEDGVISGDDLALWRRAQYPRADVLYRTTLPYKIQVDLTSYSPSWTVIPFETVLDYAANISLLTDAYPQTPILVGWQGLGHDTLYPGWDTINIRPAVGGAAGLFLLAAGLAEATRNNRSSLSYHVNADEGYALFDSAPNPNFDERICRVNVDKTTPWCQDGAATGQTPNPGCRCSISKSKDAAFYNRYTRYAKMLSIIPPVGLRTIHSDAWRDVGASWEPEPLGFVDHANEQYCGQKGDSDFWRSVGDGVSMGVEGNDGQAAELMGTVSFLYHSDLGYDTTIWGRIVTGTNLGWDLDVYCNNPGGRCTWFDMADNFYLTARVYQLALTEELLGTTAEGWHRFRGGGRVHASHTRSALSVQSGRVPTPSTWPFGGDSIPIVDGKGGALLPLVSTHGDTLSPWLLHAYQHSSGSPPYDPTCPLFLPGSAEIGADNTSVGDYASAAFWTELDPTLPLLTVVAQCNASCWANASCGAWDLIKVTPSSGKTKPTCGQFAVGAAVGCARDTNQWAGAKAPLPLPPAQQVIQQAWTLPLSWVGRAVAAVSLTPQGEAPTGVLVNGRDLMVNVTPGFAVRLTAAA
jgi:hypothetical protein